MKKLERRELYWEMYCACEGYIVGEIELKYDAGLCHAARMASRQWSLDLTKFKELTKVAPNIIFCINRGVYLYPLDSNGYILRQLILLKAIELTY